MSEAPRRLAEDPDYAADIAAAKAARPEAAMLARVERRLARPERTVARPRLALVLVLGVLISATAIAAVTDRLLSSRGEAPREAAPQPLIRPPAEPVATPDPEPEASPEPVASPEPEPTPARTPRPRRAPLRPVAPAPTPTPTPTAPPVDELKAQLERFEAAKRAQATGDAARAVRELDQLLTQWPKSVLAPEARSLRAEALAKAGRTAEAISAVESLIRDPSQGGRRAEWRRFLGDLERQRGDCRAARAAYRSALEGKLSPAEERAARAGLAACPEAP